MKHNIPFEFGVTSYWNSAFDVNESRVKRLNKLRKLAEHQLIEKVTHHYLDSFVPCVVENEGIYWIVSCFPSTDKSLVRVSIWFPEVFNIHHSFQYLGTGIGLQCIVFVHKDFIDASMEKILEKKIKGLHFAHGYRFPTGIEQQLAAFMPLTSYFDCVTDETVFESIKTHNYELSLKGKTPFKRGHNFEFVRYLFDAKNF